jgi:hypothetical protein
MIMKQDNLVKVARRVITHHEDLAAALEALRVTRAQLRRCGRPTRHR